MPRRFAFLRSLIILLLAPAAAPAFEIAASATPSARELVLADGAHTAPIVIDDHDHPVVTLAANLFADDVERVTGHRPVVADQLAGAKQIVLAGTLGHSALIDQLVAAGKLAAAPPLAGRWETTLWQIVEQPFPGVERAFVIVGSDRRGTAYGLMRLSERIGVSPWHWWADVPVAARPTLVVRSTAPETDAPAVPYRGIFINDEDWGLFPWASQTFEPEFGNIGPKTYARIFELMLRLRLNYLWPAMHACTTEFAQTPANAALADRYGIVAGASHCEPMLCNNIHWDESRQGRWNYSLNRDAIHAYWEDSAKTRGAFEAVWTLGLRGIHDQGMQSPPADPPGRIRLLEQVFRDQRALLAEHATSAWGPVAQCFVPYKEVLPLYDAGLQVPDDVAIVWVDDNFGYLRRLGAPAERQRPGGAGVYWHLSYYGGPHSYLWINTTAPALMWEELHKAWENDARRIWVINVGDLKPMEIGVDYFARFAWNPEAFGPDSQPEFLRSFVAEQIGLAVAPAAAALLGEFYRLGTIRKPEQMNRAWACALPAERADELRAAYTALLATEDRLATAVPPAARDAYFEMIGFPAQVLGASGLIFLADREVQLGRESAAREAEIARLRAQLERLAARYNDETAGGKWQHMMPGLVTAADLTKWNSQVRWPWGEKPGPAVVPAGASGRLWRDAASADRQTHPDRAKWVPISGLGSTGRALALKPASLASAWSETDAAAPTLDYAFDSPGAGEVLIDFLPTFRLCPGLQLRVTVALDDQPAVVVEVPGSSGREDENGQGRSNGILNNFVQARLPLPAHAAGRHVLKIRALDPGVVIDRISLPTR